MFGVSSKAGQKILQRLKNDSSHPFIFHYLGKSVPSGGIHNPDNHQSFLNTYETYLNKIVDEINKDLLPHEKINRKALFDWLHRQYLSGTPSSIENLPLYIGKVAEYIKLSRKYHNLPSVVSISLPEVVERLEKKTDIKADYHQLWENLFETINSHPDISILKESSDYIIVHPHTFKALRALYKKADKKGRMHHCISLEEDYFNKYYPFIVLFVHPDQEIYVNTSSNPYDGILYITVAAGIEGADIRDPSDLTPSSDLQKWVDIAISEFRKFHPLEAWLEEFTTHWGESYYMQATFKDFIDGLIEEAEYDEPDWNDAWVSTIIQPIGFFILQKLMDRVESIVINPVTRDIIVDLRFTRFTIAIDIDALDSIIPVRHLKSPAELYQYLTPPSLYPDTVLTAVLKIFLKTNTAKQLIEEITSNITAQNDTVTNLVEKTFWNALLKIYREEASPGYMGYENLKIIYGVDPLDGYRLDTRALNHIYYDPEFEEEYMEVARRLINRFLEATPQEKYGVLEYIMFSLVYQLDFFKPHEHKLKVLYPPQD